jgi:hypothetical protein
MAQMTLESIALKGVKIASNMSEETIAFTGALYIEGRKAADLKNDGQGGATFMWFEDKELEREFEAFCASLPPHIAEFGGRREELSMNAEFWISLEVSRIDEERAWKRKCKKNIIVILKAHGEGEYGQYKNWTYTPAIGAQLRERYGSELVEIVNERFI